MDANLPLDLGLTRPDLLRQAAYVAGYWIGADASIAVTNPATGRLIGHVPNLGGVETETAVAAAQAALPAWRALDAKARGVILRRWAELMVAYADDLARILTVEQGKPLVEARGEIVYAAAFLEWFADEGRRVYGDTIPAHRSDKRLLALKQPVGVVAAVTPWNFPAAMITRKVAPALAVGCTVVLKPSELTPFTALAIAVLAEEAGVPAGVFSVVTGDAAPIGQVMTDDPRVAKFTFTGSTAVGKMLAARCMATVKRVSLELGGNAPFLVFDDADVPAAVEGAIASKFRNTGQTCVCANRFIVQARVYDAFVEAFAERARQLVVGDGLTGPTDQGPLIDSRALAKVEAHVADALQGGGRLLTGGRRIEGAGAFYAPTVIADVAPDALLCREETFGPLAGVVRFETEAEGLALANASRAGLAAYVYTRDNARTWRVSEGLEAGIIGLNTGLISTEVAPFGGVKESGLGREGSHYGVDDFLDIKMVCIDVPAEYA